MTLIVNTHMKAFSDYIVAKHRILHTKYKYRLLWVFHDGTPQWGQCEMTADEIAAFRKRRLGKLNKDFGIK